MSRYLLVAAVLALFLAWPPSTPAAETVFTRATVLESVVGDVEFTRAYTVALTLPSIDCPDGRFSCTTDQVYGQVYAMRFSRRFESVREHDGKIQVDVEPRGALYLALELDPEEEHDFGIAPFGAVAKVLNARDVCAAIRIELGE